MTQTKPTAEAAPQLKGELPRILGPFDAVMIVVGGIIGSGIFLKIAEIDEAVPSYWLILAVWIIGGIVTLSGALSLAELAAMLPQAGGPYVYLREAYGRPAAFLWGWAEFSIVRTGSLGSLACGTVIYFNAFLDSLEKAGYMPQWLADRVPLSHFSQCLLTIAAVLLLSWVNIIGTRWSARTQNITTIIKVSFLALIIIGPWIASSSARVTPSPMAWPENPQFNFFHGLGLAMLAVFWPYDGWINIGPISEEVRHPQRNVPLALGIGLLVVILVYVGANIGYHAVLTIEEVQESDAVARDIFAKLAVRQEGSWINWKWLAILAPLGVMVSTFGALNSNLLAGPRIYYSMARDRLFPKFIGDVHPRFQTPANAIMAQTIWALIQIVLVFWISTKPKESFSLLTNFVILGGTIFYALTVAAVYVLRYKLPEHERPYRTWGYPVTPALYLVAAVGVCIAAVRDKENGANQIYAVGGLCLVGLLVYFFFRSQEMDAASARKRKKRK